jgi:hypothetical protein
MVAQNHVKLFNMKTLLEIIDTSDQPNILNKSTNFVLMTYKTASDLTKMMIDYLDSLGYEVWRNNNLAVKGRSFIGKKGVPDIIGYHKNYGQFIACEIKAIGDRLSVHQIEFLTHLGMCGGTSLVCQQVSDGTINLTIFLDNGESKISIWDEYEGKFREA